MMGISVVNCVGGKPYYCRSGVDPRACIFVRRDRDVLSMKSICSRDIAVIIVFLGKEAERRKLVLCSAYLPSDSTDPSPTWEICKVIEYCAKGELDVLVGCDANSYHKVWFSSDTNKRSDALMEYVIAWKLEIDNKGSIPNFVTSRKQEVLDITIATKKIAKLNRKMKGKQRRYAL